MKYPDGKFLGCCVDTSSWGNGSWDVFQAHSSNRYLLDQFDNGRTLWTFKGPTLARHHSRLNTFQGKAIKSATMQIKNNYLYKSCRLVARGAQRNAKQWQGRPRTKAFRVSRANNHPSYIIKQNKIQRNSSLIQSNTRTF